jgi:hypothetical protein
VESIVVAAIPKSTLGRILYKKNTTIYVFEHNRKAELYKLTFNTGAFEMMKSAVFSFFKKSTKDRHAEFRDNIDNDKNSVDHSIFIKDPKTGKNRFTINIYNTTSRICVNGKEYQESNDDIISILKTLDPKAVAYFNTICAKKLQDLEKASDKLSHSTSVHNSEDSPTKVPTQRLDLPALPSNDATEPDNDKSMNINTRRSSRNRTAKIIWEPTHDATDNSKKHEPLRRTRHKADLPEKIQVSAEHLDQGPRTAYYVTHLQTK